MAFLNALAGGASIGAHRYKLLGAPSPSWKTTSPLCPPERGKAVHHRPQAPGNSTPTTEEEQEPSKHEKNLMLHLSNVSHAVNHFQNR